MDDGRIGHAELALGGGVLYLADEYPEIGLKAPAPQAVSVSLMLEVPDTDAALERARERGAPVQQETRRGPRVTQCRDHRPVRTPLDAQRPDDRRRRTDPARRRRLCLGVDARTPSAPRRSTAMCLAGSTTRTPIRSPTPSSASASSACRSRPRLFCSYAVTDLAGARQAIVDAGGTVDQFEEFDFGVGAVRRIRPEPASRCSSRRRVSRGRS